MEGLVSLAKQRFSPGGVSATAAAANWGLNHASLGGLASSGTQAGEGFGLDPTCPPSCRQRPVW